MAHTVALASRASSGTQNKVSLQESCRTSHPFPCCFTRGGHSYSKFTTGSQILSTEAPLPETCPCTAQHNLTEVTANGKSHLHSGHSLGSFFLAEVFRRLRISRLLRPSSHFSPSFSSGADSLLPLLDLWERRHPTRGSLRIYTGDIELGQFFHFPGCICSRRKGALLWPHVARFFSAPLRRLFLRVCRSFHFSPKSESRSHSPG